MSVEIQRADPRLRIRFLILMTIVAALGAAGILYLDAYLSSLHTLGPLLKPMATEKAMRAVQAFLAVLIAAAGSFSLYLGWLSAKPRDGVMLAHLALDDFGDLAKQVVARLLYRLTEKGLDLIPILLEIIHWGAVHEGSARGPKGFMERLQSDREGLIEDLRQARLRGD